jgi:hypothetical protein
VLILAFALVLLLAGCAGHEIAPSALPPVSDPAGPAPAYRKLISAQLVQIAGNTAAARTMQISPLRRVDSFKGPAWMVCLRSTAAARPLDRAVFFQDEKIVDSRLAVRADRCEDQPYQAFGLFTDSHKAVR